MCFLHRVPKWSNWCIVFSEIKPEKPFKGAIICSVPTKRQKVIWKVKTAAVRQTSSSEGWSHQFFFYSHLHASQSKTHLRVSRRGSSALFYLSEWCSICSFVRFIFVPGLIFRKMQKIRQSHLWYLNPDVSEMTDIMTNWLLLSIWIISKLFKKWRFITPYCCKWYQALLLIV